MKISLSHEKLHQLSLYSNFTRSLHAILKLPGNSPTYATLELIYPSGYLTRAICTEATDVFLHNTLQNSSQRAPFPETPEIMSSCL